MEYERTIPKTHTPDLISAFQYCSAYWDTKYLHNSSALFDAGGIWGDSQDEFNISIEDIKLALKRGDLGIQPNVFADNPVDDQRCNHSDCSREEHIQRIVWIIRNYEPTKTNIQVEAIKGTLSVKNGNHTLVAAIYLEVEEVKINFSMGVRSEVETIAGFIRWENPPANKGIFGTDIISTGKNFWQVDKTSDDIRVWVNDSTGSCVAQYKSFDKKGCLININGTGDMGTHIDLNYFIDKCATYIDPSLRHIHDLF